MNGFYIINKPKGMTSSQVVGKIKFLLGRKFKVGHMGTLDPLASGVLPIAVGRATRLFDFLLQKKKTYIATFQFGYLTDTLDNTGTTLQETDKIPTFQELQNILPKFLGVQQQMPPQYSAKSVNGKRAYDLARNGEYVELKPCKIEIFDIQVLRQLDSRTFELSITCSGGTYIRSIARDLGIALNSLGTMTNLIRTQSGMFKIADAMHLDDFDNDKILPMQFVLKDYPVLNLTEMQLKTILDGKKLILNDVADNTYVVYYNDSIQCLCEVIDKVLKPTTWLR